MTKQRVFFILHITLDLNVVSEHFHYFLFSILNTVTYWNPTNMLATQADKSLKSSQRIKLTPFYGFFLMPFEVYGGSGVYAVKEDFM